MIKITVKLFATLRQGRFDIAEREYPAGTTIGRVIENLELPPEKVTIIFLNHRHAQPEQELSEGDVLAFFPPIGGG